ncbi:hypothetical protein MMC25_005257 [Agyrium rufum]|nr:hypothetical protein [Agyrium rufum]
MSAASALSSVVLTRDIYHGLPTFSEDKKGLTVVVTGANGISGSHMVGNGLPSEFYYILPLWTVFTLIDTPIQIRVLAESPERWTKIYALSRRPTPFTLPPQVQHISVDFLSSPSDIASALKSAGVTHIDHVFFFTYAQPDPPEGEPIWSNNDELIHVNMALLCNFCEALSPSEANLLPERILLQLGAKYYGVHLGPAATPMEESDPRVNLQPNFYYEQEDYLMDFCAKHGVGWSTTRPSHILGAVPDNAMNLVFPLAAYASVQRYLGKPLEFTSDLAAWENPVSLSSAQMIGYLSEWMVLTPSARDESFNAVDDCAFSFGKFWPRFANRFGVDWKGPDVSKSVEWQEIETASDSTPRGFGPKATLRFKFTLAEWAKRPEVKKAWAKLAEKYDLRVKEFWDVDRVFGFTDFGLAMPFACHLRLVFHLSLLFPFLFYPRFCTGRESQMVIFCTNPMKLADTSLMYSTSKQKQLGFFGFVDSYASLFKVMEEFAEMKMIPPLP